MSDIAEALAKALGEKANYFEPTDRPWGDEDEIGRIRTKPGYIFDDDFWDVFHALDLHICHVAYYGPKRLEDADRTKDTGIFELRYTWRRISDDERTIRKHAVERVLDAIREYRQGDIVPAGAVLAAVYIDPDRQIITPEIEQRAREIQDLIDAEEKELHEHEWEHERAFADGDNQTCATCQEARFVAAEADPEIAPEHVDRWARVCQTVFPHLHLDPREMARLWVRTGASSAETGGAA